MAKRITLSDIKTNIRKYGEWSIEYISENELKTWINEALFKFHSMMSIKEPLRYIKTSIIPVVSGTSEYDLPDDFFRLSGIAVQNDGYDGYLTLDSFNWDERYNLDYVSTREGTKYLIKGSNSNISRDGYYVLQLMPTPTYSGPIILDYIPAVTNLTNDTDTFDTINGVGFSWICADAAIRCASKEETDTSQFEKAKAEAQAILLEISTLDLPETKTSKISNTLQAIQRSIRGRGSWERGLFSDTELTEYINSSISSLRDILLTKDASYFLKRKDISILPGVAEYDLPTDFYKVIGVAMIDGSNPDGYSVVSRHNWNERYDSSFYCDDFKYEVRNNKISFNAANNTTSAIRLEYVPLATPLVNPGDTFKIGSGHWVEWVILDCCIKCSAMANTDPKIYMAQKLEVERRIIDNSSIDIGKPKTVTNVSRRRWYR